MASKDKGDYQRHGAQLQQKVLVVRIGAKDRDVALLQQQPIGDGADQLQQAAPAAGAPRESRVAGKEDDHRGFHDRVWQSVHQSHPSGPTDASRSASTIDLVRNTSIRTPWSPEAS